METDSALELKWTFGFNHKLVGGVHNLSTDDSTILFYVSAHTGVIYDAAARTQKLLQGHKVSSLCALGPSRRTSNKCCRLARTQ